MQDQTSERPEAKRARHLVQNFTRRRLAHKIIGLEKQLAEARGGHPVGPCWDEECPCNVSLDAS